MISNTIRLLELQTLFPNSVAAIFVAGRCSSYPGLASGNDKHVYVYRILAYNLTCYIQTYSFSDNIFTDVVCFRQLERRSFVILKKNSFHVMKAIAWHGVVIQLVLKVGIMGTA